MAFDSLAPQPPMNPDAEAYSAEALRLSREAARTTRCVLDLAYGSDPAQTLDLYLPPDTAQARDLPVLMLMHGGGWTHGHKEWMGLNAPPLVSVPAIVASVSYRLMPAHPYPAALDDCIAALAWLRGNVVRWGGARRIFVGGHSAGGQLATLVALRRDLRAAAGLPDDAVQACFAVSTTFNRRMVNPELVPHEPAPADPYAVHPDSPLAHAGDARVPFFIVWGGREHERLGITGRKMIAALEAVGTPVDHAVYPEHDHFTIHLDQRRAENPWVQRVRRWLVGGVV